MRGERYRPEQKTVSLMKNRNLYLHIGFNKTGSSYIQKCLVENNDGLRKMGFIYLGKSDASYFQNNQHVPLAAALSKFDFYWLNNLKRKTIGKASDDFFRDLAATDQANVIVSSEAFGDVHLEDSDIENILLSFQGFNVFVIAYIRRQDDYMLSAFQQDIKTGQATSSFNLKERIMLKQNDFAKRLAPWRKALSKERIIVREYAKDQWFRNDLFLDFLNAIGVPEADWQLATSVNEGLDYREVDLLIRLNRHLENNLPELKFKPLRNKIRWIVLRTLQSLPAPKNGRQKLRLSSAEIADIAKYFEASNKRLLGANRGGRFIPKPSEHHQGNTSQTKPSIPLMMKVIVALAKRLAQQKPAGN